jgi:hypothetical protein
MPQIIMRTIAILIIGAVLLFGSPASVPVFAAFVNIDLTTKEVVAQWPVNIDPGVRDNLGNKIPGNEKECDRNTLLINYQMTGNNKTSYSSPPSPPVRELPITTPRPTPAPIYPNESDDSRIIELRVDNMSVTCDVTTDGVLMDKLAITSADGSFSLSIEQGTQIQLSNEFRQDSLDLNKIGDTFPWKIEVTNPSVSTAPAAPDGWMPVSPYFDINGVTNGYVTGVKMDNPALIVIKYNETLLPAVLDDLAAYYYNYRVGWTQLKPTEGFIAEGPEVAAQVDHFSLFVVLAKEGIVNKPPAKIVVQKLTINPPRIMLGQSSEVRVKVNNEGGLAGESDVVLKMDGKVQKNQIVHLEPGQSTELALIVSPGQNGIYTLTAGLAFSDLVVDPGVSPDVSETNYWWLLCIALGVSTILFSFFRGKVFTETDDGEK